MVLVVSGFPLSVKNTSSFPLSGRISNQSTMACRVSSSSGRIVSTFRLFPFRSGNDHDVLVLVDERVRALLVMLLRLRVFYIDFTEADVG